MLVKKNLPPAIARGDSSLFVFFCSSQIIDSTLLKTFCYSLILYKLLC